MSKIRIGFVGVGGMGQAAHLRNYVSIPDCEITAIAELRPELAKKVAARYGVPKVYSTDKELLANEKLDGIISIQPFGMHKVIVPHLLSAGIPVMTEKPLAESVESGEAIVAAVKKTGTPLYLAYHKRSDPATAYVKQQMDLWLKTGEMGKLKYIRMAMPPGDWSVQGFSQNVYTDENYASISAGGGRYVGFVNYYIHQVNLIRFLLGHDYHVQHADAAGLLLIARSDAGVSITLEMATYRTTVDWQEEAFVAFERGWIKLELPAPLAIDRPGRVTVFSDPDKSKTPTTTVPSLPWIHAHRQQAIHFVNAIRGQKTPLCESEDGLKDLLVAREYIAAAEAAEAAVKKV